MGNGDWRFFFIQLDHYLAQIGTDQDIFSWRRNGATRTEKRDEQPLHIKGTDFSPRP
jgi:hypothetical protein